MGRLRRFAVQEGSADRGGCGKRGAVQGFRCAARGARQGRGLTKVAVVAHVCRRVEGAPGARGCLRAHNLHAARGEGNVQLQQNSTVRGRIGLLRRVIKGSNGERHVVAAGSHGRRDVAHVVELLRHARAVAGRALHGAQGPASRGVARPDACERAIDPELVRSKKLRVLVLGAGILRLRGGRDEGHGIDNRVAGAGSAVERELRTQEHVGCGVVRYASADRGRPKRRC